MVKKYVVAVVISGLVWGRGIAPKEKQEKIPHPVNPVSQVRVVTPLREGIKADVFRHVVQAKPVEKKTGKLVYLSESFETSVPPSEWSSEILSGSYDWEQYQGTRHPSGYDAYDGQYVAIYRSWSASSGSHARLISDTVDLSGATSPELSFAMFHDGGYSSAHDSLVVEIKAKSGSDPWPTDWTRLQKYERYSSSTGWVVHEIDLSGYIGDSVIVAFHAYSDYGNDIHIDRVEISEPSANDVGVVSIIKPHCTPFDSANADSVGVVITNFGSNSQSNFYVKYDLVFDAGTNSVLYTNTISQGDTDTVYIPWTPGRTGTDTIYAWTELSNDENLSNDTSKVTVEIYDYGTILVEGFEGDFPPACWDTSGTHWSRSSYTYHSGSYSAYCSKNATNEYLETYEMDLGSGGPYQMEFYWYNSSSGDSDSTYVEVWNGTRWDTLACLQPGTSSWEHEKYSLINYNNPDFKVRWRYVSNAGTYAYSFYLDDVKIWPLPDNDVGVSSLDTIETEPLVEGDSDDWKVWVKNFGAQPQTNVTVYMEVDGQEVGNTTVSSIDAGDSALATISWSPSSSGVKSVKFYTVLSGDEDHSDDTLALSAIIYGSAVQAPLNEGFEGTFPPSGWITWDLNGDGKTWEQSDVHAHNGTYSARTPNDNGNYPNNSNDRLYSPMIDLGSKSNALLSYYHFDSLENNYDFVKLYVLSYSGVDDPDPDINLLTSHTGYTSDWEESSFNLTGVKRYNIFMWYFTSDGSVNKPGFFLDDVSISSQIHDVEVDSITVPGDTVHIGETYTPTVWIQNVGDFDESNFDVVMYIYEGSDTAYADTVHINSISAGVSMQVSMDNWTVPEHHGHQYDVKTFITLNDQVSSDDTLETTTTLYSHEGHDNHGWNWRDSHASGGLTYQWIELTGNPTEPDSVDTLFLGDDGVQRIGLTNPVKIYGVTFDSVYVGANGGIDFVDDNIGFSNSTLPSSSQKVFFAVFWDDLRCASGETNDGDSLVYVGYFKDTLTVIEWYQVPRISTQRKFTFEILIHTKGNNNIIFQYKDMSAYDPASDDATIGIQDSSAANGTGNYILYTYDETPFIPNWSEKSGLAIEFVNPDVATGLQEPGNNLPSRFEFSITPNVVNSRNVSIRFALPKDDHVKIKVYDITGRMVKVLMDGMVKAGYHDLKWNLRSSTGSMVRRGVYFIKVETTSEKRIQKVIFLR